MVLALDGQKKHGEAEQMYRQTLEVEKVLGREHPETLKASPKYSVGH